MGNRLFKKVCKNCGKEYEGQRKSFLCSKACRNAIHARSDMLVAKRPKTCKVCGKEFMAFRANAKYCSRTCIDHATWERKKTLGPRPKRPQNADWHSSRENIYKEQEGICWLCKEPLGSKFSAHHLDYGDHSPTSPRLVPLHSRCHTLMHHIQICPAAGGNFSFHGKALDLIKERNMKGRVT